MKAGPFRASIGLSFDRSLGMANRLRGRRAGVRGGQPVRRTPSTWLVDASRLAAEISAMNTPQHQPMAVLTDLPDDLYTTIGMVVVQFSYLEWIINRIIYDLKDLDTPAGRQLSFGRQVKERLDFLFQLVDERGLAVAIDRPALRRHAIEYEGKRDLLSHAIFVRDPAGAILVRDAKRGKQQIPGSRGPAIDKSVEPSGEGIDAEIVARLAENIGVINRALEALWREIAPQLPNSRHGKM